MADKLLVGTRKGVFVIGRHGREWRVDRAELLGDPVTMVLGERDGTLLAAQDMGHFGVKMKRSRDGGATWQ
ncbi:MAG TPA: exo-alpha-sialidase, partial [Gammaproteobacteria bacterium]|nr:exo-alpha-sialidase [Gammaproteobacteria bacterium]